MLLNFLKTGMSSDLTTKDGAMIWHPYSSLVGKRENIVIDSAKGAYLYTKEGRAILDAISSWWVNLHGHAHPYLVQKISEQASKMEHVIFAGFTHEPAIRLAERLLAILPGNQKRIFYSDNGSTAVEVALKMAIQYKVNKGVKPGKILALEGAFHGDTFGAMAISERGIFTKPFDKYLFEVEFVPFPKEGKEENSLTVFQEKARSGAFTAFIYEPLVQGAAGMRIYSPEVLEKMLSIAKKHSIVCIADEVMTGFGRTGKLFASEYMATKPDIICLSKGITSGFMAFGATACNKEIEAVFLNPEVDKTFFHGHSYTGNPLACAVSNASLDLLLKEECNENIVFINKSHIEFKSKIMIHPRVGKVSVLGTILAIEIATSSATSYTNTIRDTLYDFFLDKNILIRPLGNVIYILPPYIMTKEQLTLIYNAIEELLTNLNN